MRSDKGIGMLSDGWTPTAVASALLGALMVTIVPALHAQTVSGARDTSFTVSRNSVIDITVRTGSLLVRGTDGNTAELRTDQTNYQLRSSGVSVTLSVGNGDNRSRSTRSNNREVDVELLVPRDVRVVIHGSSVDVRASNLAGDVEVHTNTGDVVLESLGGRALIETLTGDTDITGVGDLRYTSVSGDLRARAVRGTVDVTTTSGDIVLDVQRAPQVQVTGMTSDITLSGTVASDARLQFSTHSGDVTMRLPESTGGQIDVSTFSGEISGGRMTLMPSSDGRTNLTGGRRLDRSAKRFEFGDGGNVRITVSTFSGDVTLQRGARRGSEQ